MSIFIPTTREMIERAAHAAGRIFRKDGRLEHPIWHFVAPSGEQYVMAHPDVGDRDLAAFIMRGVLREARAVAYVCTVEAWVLMTGADDAEVARARREGLSNHPRRREALCYQAEDQLGTLLAQQEIERPPGRKPRLLAIQWLNFTQSEGRMAGMLPRAGATQH